MSGKRIFERRLLPKGEVVVREGETGDCAYLIQSGQVMVYTEHQGRVIDLAHLKAGDIFGEMALAGGMPCSASVKTMKDTMLIVIRASFFQQKLERSDATVQALLKMLIERMASANRMVSQKRGSVKELERIAYGLYESIILGLTPEEKQVFEEDVYSKFQAFLRSVEAFDEKFSDYTS